MTLRVDLSVETNEDCQAAISILEHVMAKLPNYRIFAADEAKVMKSSYPDEVVSNTGNISPENPIVAVTDDFSGVEDKTDTVVNPQDARNAEQVLLTEAVAKRGRGRPKKNAESPSVVVENMVSDDKDLLDIRTPEENMADTDEVVADEVVSDDILSLLGDGSSSSSSEPVGDKYSGMNHAELYAEVRNRSGKDIKAPALGLILREASSRDKKCDSVFKFSEDMLHSVLLDADDGLMNDAVKFADIIKTRSVFRKFS